MRPLPLTLLLAALPLLFGYWVNTHAPYPTTTLYATHCTRYCMAHGCPHATRANSPAYFQLRPVYRATVKTLMAGGRGWYAAVNIGVFLLLVPGLLLGLTYGAVRDAGRLRALKRRAV